MQRLKFYFFFPLCVPCNPPLTEYDGRPEGTHIIGTGTTCKLGILRDLL